MMCKVGSLVCSSGDFFFFFFLHKKTEEIGRYENAVFLLFILNRWLPVTVSYVLHANEFTLTGEYLLV